MFRTFTPKRALHALILTAATLAPATARAEMSKCTDQAWANYNTCLMNSGGFEWARRECDIEFQAEYLACYGAIITGLFGLVARAT